MKDPPNAVVVTDFDMSFWSMVRFLVKLTVASIPAVLILVLVASLAWGVVMSAFVAAGNG